jgi:prepilin-type N-terminal cleavage/methylation domain-containing protein
MKDRKGFTLIELLIVVIVVGILAAAGIGKYQSFAEKARTRVCMSNQTEIGNAIAVWCTTNRTLPEDGSGWMRFSMTDGRTHIDNWGWGPSYPWSHFDTNVGDTMRDRQVWLCPGTLSYYFQGDQGRFRQNYPGQSGIFGYRRWAYNHIFRGPNTGFSWAINGAWGTTYANNVHDLVFCGEWGVPNDTGPDGSQANRHSARW